MILSMTGFGAATADRVAFRGGVVIRSLNHRFLDVTVRLPQVLGPLETEIKDLVASRVRRGRVDVTVRGEVRGAGRRVSTSGELAEALVGALRTLAREHGLDEAVRVSDVVQFPGLLEVYEDPASGAAAARADVVDLVKQALDSLDGLRRTEGARLAATIEGHLGAIGQSVEEIARASDEGRSARRDALVQRARELRLDPAMEEGRLYQEVARLVDRSDVCEELERLRGHVAHAREILEADAPAGKTLDFLAQEMAREANTIGSKSPAGSVGRLVIGLRTEVERLREQVQNVE
jgi:uncharacterized protein (TIGR00255 family)